MSTDLEALAQPRTIQAASSEATAVEQARAVAEVAAAVKVAQEFPRNVAKAVSQMEQACSQQALADKAFFSLPRGGRSIEGSSVHLARELARCWGNLDYGVRELRRDDAAGVSEMQAWAWDQENNVRSSRSFVVPHARMARKQRETLTDLGDIANNNNSVAARAVRETIFTVLPIWFREQAESMAARTLQQPDGPPLAEQAASIVKAFAGNAGVTQANLEAHVGKPVSEWSAQDLGVLRVIGGEIARGEKRVEDVFGSGEGVTADEIGAGS